MPAAPTVPVLLVDLCAVGSPSAPRAGPLAVRPASALTAGDRVAIRERRAELLAALSPVGSAGPVSRIRPTGRRVVGRVRRDRADG